VRRQHGAVLKRRVQGEVSVFEAYLG
jgi:hypothetical protein